MTAQQCTTARSPKFAANRVSIWPREDPGRLPASVAISATASFLFGIVQPDGTVKVTKKLIGARPYADFKSAIDTMLPRM